jgi:hypothetical protein
MVPYPQTLQYAQDLVKTVVAGDSLTQDDLQKNAPKFR